MLISYVMHNLLFSFEEDGIQGNQNQPFEDVIAMWMINGNVMYHNLSKWAVADSIEYIIP